MHYKEIDKFRIVVSEVSSLVGNPGLYIYSIEFITVVNIRIRMLITVFPAEY